MKKLLLFLNIILLGIIGFMACNSKQNATSSIPCLPADSCMARFVQSFTTGELKGKIEGLLLESMTASYASDSGKNFITGTTIFHPDDDHRTARIAFGQQRDARSTVFDLKKMKLLIWEMYKNACVNHCDTSMELGIRFYYIKYPANAGDGNGPPSLLGLPRSVKLKHSLVMVPVYKSKNDGEWYDYDLWGGKPGCFNRIDSLSTGDSEFPLFFGVGNDFGDNHGGVGPPPETGSFPTNEP